MDSKTLTPGKQHSSSHYSINHLNTDSLNSIFRLQQAIGNQAVQRIIRSNNSAEGFNYAKISILQPKLKVSQPGDEYEQEADRIAEQVMRSHDMGSSVLALSSKDEQGISRKCAACQIIQEKEDIINRKPSNLSANLQATDETVNGIINNRSSGRTPLDIGTKGFMESRFGYNFSNVKIHADETAARSANSVNALAYTVGDDIVFGEGQYQPHTLDGRRLLAHELTHVIQQKESNATSALGSSVVLRQTDAGVSVASNIGQQATRPASRSVIQALQTADPVAGVGDYPQAFRILNGLAMFDMLATLDELKSLSYFDLLAANILQATGVNQSRILIAMRAAEEKINNITTNRFAEKYQELFTALPIEQQSDINTFLQPLQAPVMQAAPAKKTVTVNHTKLHGSTGSIDTAISFANTKVYNQADVEIKKGKEEPLDEPKSKATIGDDLILDEYTDGTKPTTEEKALFKINQTAGAITAYYVKALSAGSTGESFIPSWGVGFVGVVIGNSGIDQTFSHELGHMLLNSGCHVVPDATYLMHPTVGAGKTKLTPDQITKIKSSPYVK
jgi:hypothetical protein